MARLVALASFWHGGRSGAVVGHYEAHVRALIWVRILREQGLGEKAFVAGDVLLCEGFPWGKLSPEVTDEWGRPGCPTEQEKIPLGRHSPPLSASTRKGWVQGRPLIRPSVRTGHLPQGEGFGRWEVLSCLRNHSFPARPAGGRAVTGVRDTGAAGQAEKRDFAGS